MALEGAQEGDEAEGRSDPAASPPSLRERSVTASFWVFGGYGFQQALRIASNLILTRLLFPEAFGLMALVNAVMHGLNMFTDVGVRGSVVHNERGEEPAFLRTAWTLQILRGTAVAGSAWLLSAPLARLFAEPQLGALIPVVALGAFANGFASINLLVQSRRLDLRRVVAVEVASQAAGILFSIGYALWRPEVWAIAYGAIVAGLANVLFSHWWVPGVRNRIHWDPAAARELYRWGRWIFWTTMLKFLSERFDRLLLGKLMGVELLAFFAIAAMLVEIIPEMAARLGQQVLFPSYSELQRRRPEVVYANLRRVRLLLLLPMSLVALGLVATGSLLIRFLYDPRYWEAGPMLAILSTGLVAQIVSVSYHGIILSQGKPAYLLVALAGQTIFKLGGILVGHAVAGPTGIVAGIAASQWLTYGIRALTLRRIGFWQKEVDLPILGASLLLLLAWHLVREGAGG